MTTTYDAIRERQAILLRTATSQSFVESPFKDFDENVKDSDLRTWADVNADSCFRQFQISELEDEDPPAVNNGDVRWCQGEQEITVAYDLTYSYGPANRRDLTNTIRQDKELIRGSLADRGRGNYGMQVAIWDLGETETEEQETTAILAIRFALGFYVDMPQPSWPAMQNSQEQSFQYTVTAADVIAGGMTFAVTWTRAMVDTTYICQAQVSEVPALGATATLVPDDSTKTRTSITINAAGALVAGTIIDVYLRDLG